MNVFERFAQRAKEDGIAAAWAEHFEELVKAQRLSGDDHWKKLFAELHAADGVAPEATAKRAAPTDPWDSPSHEEFKRALGQLARENIADHPEVRDGDGSQMKVLHRETFRNWGRTVENIPEWTFFPMKIEGVKNIVKWAKSKGKKVRVAGYRHTWSDFYSANDEVLISALPLDVATELPAKEPPINPNNELQGIEIVGTINEGGQEKGLCKLGAATTNEQFRKWAIDMKGKGCFYSLFIKEKRKHWEWTVPLNVIMVEITWGGSNAPICHGAGIRNQTLSDLVYEIEFVNAKGELQTVNDPDLLKAASGCFGLLGVVTSVTLKLDRMTYAVLEPKKKRVGLAIPPPQGLTIPQGVDMSGITQADRDQAYQTFVQEVESSYYSEYFWFVFQKDCWVNCWKNNGQKDQATLYPGPFGNFFQQVEEYLAQLVTETSLFQALSPKTQADIMAGGAMLAMPSDKTFVTPLIEGLHFRRGIQNMRVYDMEWEIPIPALASDPTKPDWSLVQKAWWAVITAIYNRYNADPNDVPCRLTMEMRIMADSNVTMAPQYGNTFGTASIEVLTIMTTPLSEWQAFMQEITDVWTSYTDHSGAPLNARPHWAKQWQGLQVRGKTIEDYLVQDAYAARLPEFQTRLRAIAQAGGYTTADMKNLFTNPLSRRLFGSIL